MRWYFIIILAQPHLISGSPGSLAGLSKAAQSSTLLILPFNLGLTPLEPISSGYLARGVIEASLTEVGEPVGILDKGSVGLTSHSCTCLVSHGG